MATLLHPAQVSTAQVLGDFLERFSTAGVILSCLHQQRVYHFGLWANTEGMDFVFSRLRAFAEPTPDANVFADAWNTPSVDVFAPYPAEPTGPALDVSQLDDQKILLHFMKHVDCRASLLTYQGDDHMSWGFWRWRAKDGEQWARAAWKNERHGCPSWSEASLGAGQLCPATYVRVIQDASAYHREVTARMAAADGWSEDDIATCNALPNSY